MTLYTWPTSGKAFIPASMTWTQRHNTRVSTSSLNGATQTSSLPGSRWAVTLDFPQQSYAERAELEGFLTRLGGMEHRLALWDLARPTPAALGGTPTVNGALAQFAQTLNIDGALRGGVNLVAYSQAFDQSAWGKGNIVAVTADTVTAPDGTVTAEKLVPNTTATNHVLQQAVGGIVAGDVITMSVYAKADTYGFLVVQLGPGTVFQSGYDTRVDLNSGTFATGQAGTPTARGLQPVGGGWYRVWITAVASGSGTFTSQCFLSPVNNYGTAGNGTDGIDLWGWMVERAERPSIYTGMPAASPGDWLQLPLTGGAFQLVQVVNSVAGETLPGVEFRPALRGAVADNAAIIITRAPARFMFANPELSIPRGGSNKCPPFSVELVEVFS